MGRRMYRLLIISALALLGIPPAALWASGRDQKPPVYYPDGRPDAVHWPSGLGRHGAEFQYLQGREGHIPPARNGSGNPLVTAVAQQKALSTTGGSWAGLGPNPISYFGTTATGRVLAEAYDAPLNTLFLGGADGGVWEQTPGGNWSPLTDNMPDLAIGALTVSPADSSGKTIFAGTGEPDTPGDGFGGVGIYESTDGGTTWHQYGLAVMDGQSVSAIAVDKSQPKYVYAGMVNYRSSGNLGVAVSMDGGLTWNEPATGGLQGQNVTSLAIDAAGDVYAGVKGLGVYISTDHGVTWNSISTGLAGAAGQIYSLALAPSTANLAQSSQVLYVTVGSAATNGLLGVYKTTNGGTLWTATSLTQVSPIMTPGFSQAWYDIYTAISPTDPNTVYVGLTDIFKSTDGGTTWTNLTKVYSGGGTIVHPDQHAAAFVPGSTAGTGTWYFGNDGGVYSTSDGGTTWSANNGKLALTQFYDGIVGNSQNPSYALGGTQDNGTVDLNNPAYGAQWGEEFGGDGFFVALDPTTSAVTNAYGEYTYGQIYSTHDDWTTANYIYSSAWHVGKSTDPTPPDANFGPPFVMDPNSATTLYMGRASLWKTTNANAATPTWTDLNIPTNFISAIGVSKTAPTTLYVGDNWYESTGGSVHNDYLGHMWVSTNDGTSWNAADGSSTAACTPSDSSPRYCPVLGSQVTSIAVDPTAGSTVFATVSSYEGAQKDHVFKSTDNGAHWTDVSTSLPDVPFESVAIDPANHNEVFAGSDIGAYVSFDGGSTWSTLGTSLPNVAVFDLVPNAAGTQLTAFTHGRGAWVIPIPSASTSANVPIAVGFNQLDVPQLNTGLTTASSVVSAISSQLGSGAAAFLGKYVNGRFKLFVPNFSADFNVQPTDGFFVYSTKSGTWTVSGTTPTTGQLITLYPAWNLVAAPFPVGGLLSTQIASEASTCSPREIALYNTATSTYQVWTTTAPTSFTIPAYNGFWIQCANAGSMTPS